MDSIRREVSFSPILVSKVYKSTFQKANSLTAELRQEVVVKSYYPKTKMANSLNSQLFSDSEFGIEEEVYTSTETRVCFVNVPESMDTPEKVQEHLKKYPEACLYRTLSDKPILSKEDISAIEQGFTSMDKKALGQIVRIPSGELALTKSGKVQYRRISLSDIHKEDVDLRTDNVSSTYIPSEIREELEGTIVSVDDTEQKF